MLDRRPQSEEFPKDVHGVWMTPGERPRQALPFPSSTDCPKCGSHGWAENTGEVFHCLACGTWLFRDPPAPWSRDNNKILCHKHPRRREITVTCQRCGKEFGTNNHNGMVKYCPDCREDARAEHQRELDRNRKSRKRKETTCGS
jgi:hypothetical protein